MPALFLRLAACAALLLVLVGSGASAQASPGVASTTAVPLPTATATTRYVGVGPFQAVLEAAAATARSCTISDKGLAALVWAPVFKESSAATTVASAPAPMTLSRYDEWSGVFDTNSSANANYGLYAFRNPYTSYVRAYWHPGIGIWQYDSAGLGAPFTAVEAMDVRVVAADVARVMASRYCNPPTSLVGHGAPFSDQERRYAAWGDWGFPCTQCQTYFGEMTASVPYFANVKTVPGIDALGGTVARTCSLPDVVVPVPCWYVQPVVGVIQGSTAWATYKIDGGGNPTVAPAPLSAAFYVVDRGTTEERHWLRADTGYSIDIKASRTIGKNARPRSSQPGSGLTWSSSSGLCDLTTVRGACRPLTPPGLSSSSPTIVSVARAIALDADGDQRGDLLFYGPGGVADTLLLGQGSGTFSTRPATVNLVYDYIIAGDADGDGDDEVLFYNSVSGLTFLWRSNGDGTFTSVGGLAPGVGLMPLFLDRDCDGAQELFWYGTGALADKVWDLSGGTVVSSAVLVSGRYQPFVGDFDGNGCDDIFFYAPGGDPDFLWLHKLAGGYLSLPRSVFLTYEPAVGDFDGDRRDDVLWYGPGVAQDYMWYGGPLGTMTSSGLVVNGLYNPVVADLYETGRDDVVWYAPGPAADFLWRFASRGVWSSSGLVLPSLQEAVVGGFSTGGDDGIFWYGLGNLLDAVWYR
ncbi:MAG: hypothetical protein EXQ71_00700 [Acidimicrobiia bacterium]|nr:hypothetical protein [Acidimicrobiia bacterium]